LSSRKLKRSPAALALGLLALAGCTDAAGYDLDMLMGKAPWLATMRNGVQYDPYEGGPRPAPEGSVAARSPNGDRPAHFAQTQLDSAAATLRNPYPADAAMMARGQVAYERNCTVCHGPAGAGNGPVVGPNKFPYAPAINAAATQARSDGYVYGVIRVGRGLMPPYGDRMTEADIWATVAYLRRLQGAGEVVAPPPAVPGVQPAGPALTDTLIEPSAATPTGTAPTDTAPAQPR
jgi:mono/diheme cytochrome c family protein